MQWLGPNLFGNVMHMFNYILPVAASLIALLQLAKDWGAHQTTWRRGAALVLIVLFGIRQRHP
jgi:hypothetical protein